MGYSMTRCWFVLVATIAIAQPAVADDLMALFEPACASVGIDPERCQCVVEQVVERHGEAAARYVALDMNLRYDEAAAALESVGEDTAFAASSTFEVAQNKACSSSRLARQQGLSPRAGSANGAVSAADIAAPQAPATGVAGTTDVFVPTSDVPLIDLTAHRSGAVIDVSARFDREALATASTTNFRNFIGFYPVVDSDGGIDLNGNGAADVRPGDDTYVVSAQARVLPNKLYWRADGGQQQYVGEVRLPGGSRYAPVIRYRSKRRPTVPAIDSASQEQMMRAMTTNANLFFGFPAVHANRQHIRKLDNNVFGFQITGYADSTVDTITVMIDTLVFDE
ncbi:MAG: hypothetical protein AAGC71_09895 [Pseudomonadota bacterium]